MEKLFGESEEENFQLPPLAERVRPKTLEEFIGQEKLLGSNGPLGRMIRSGRLHSFLIYGPPGTGKTTVAMIASKGFKRIFISATTAHIKDIRSLIARMRKENKFSGSRQVLIIDEIQHFNRKEQDAFLEAVEKGEIILIALTTENPSFYINRALLSRLSVFTFSKLTDLQIEQILKGAVLRDKMFQGVEVEEGVFKLIAGVSEGDARRALNILESVATSGSKRITVNLTKQFLRKDLSYGKEQHYDLISAFIKSMRGSDPDAALYYFYRMVKAGEDPLYIGRRMIRFAAEDIGLKDPDALVIANSAFEGFQKVGPPEGYLVLAEAVVYLSRAPKSNAVYLAEKKIFEEIERSGDLEVPKKLRNPVTRLMKMEGYGEGYRYPHNYPGHVVKGEKYLPEEIEDKKFYSED